MHIFSSRKEFYKSKSFVHLIFWTVTAIMLITRYAAFYSYSGDDDLHYALLSSKFLQGSYNAFFADDIFSARAIIVLYQALWFKIFGIGDFAMNMPALSVLIFLAWFVCFKCNLYRDAFTAILGSSLIYFNPVITKATSGNLPDVYLALIAVVVFYLIKKNVDSFIKHRNILSGVLAGLLLITGLFVKENIILIWVGAAAMLVFYRKKIAAPFVIAGLVTVAIGVAGYLRLYYINTGDFFHHFVQIKNSAYFNGCSYDCLPAIYLVKRLTITVPFVAIVEGAYPLLLLIPVMVAYKQNTNSNTRFWKITLLSLTLLALYFPFSISPYVPMCHDMRHFFFLFPFAAILCLSGIKELQESAKATRVFNIAGSIVFILITLICLFFTPYNKWGILCNALLALLFIGNIFSPKKIQTLLLYLLLPAVLWLTTVYTIFKKPHQGYQELKMLQAVLKSNPDFNTNTYYFLNNDTKSHFALINKFDAAKQFLNLDTVQKGFKPYVRYQNMSTRKQPLAFQKGWLIVSDDYYEGLNAYKVAAINKILAEMPCSNRINKTAAYYLTSADTKKRIMDILNVRIADTGCN